MLRQTTQQLITALYPRLSHEDELQGESNSISNQHSLVLVNLSLIGLCRLLLQSEMLLKQAIGSWSARFLLTDC